MQFRSILRANQNSHLQWYWKFYPDDNHISLPLIASYDALRAIFKEYELEKNLSDTTITVSYIQEHYRKVSSLLNYSVLPSENMVNLLGYNFLSIKSYKKAHSSFMMNVKNYPASPNTYDSLGDYYVEVGDRKKAIESFKKALSLKELPETRKKLIQLQGNK